MQELQVSDLISNANFWIKLIILLLTGYVANIVRRFNKDIGRLFKKSDEHDKELEDINEKIAEHAGWHKGKGDIEK